MYPKEFNHILLRWIFFGLIIGTREPLGMRCPPRGVQLEVLLNLNAIY
jgi:hypothetical protein